MWWLFLHRRLRSRQRGPIVPKNIERRSTLSGRSFPAGVGRFYPSNSSDLAISLASLSASAPSVSSSGFPLLLLSSDTSPHPLHLSVPVKIPVSNLDCDVILQHGNFVSSTKYFNSRPDFTGRKWISCGNHCGKIVDKNVDNGRRFLAPQFKLF